MDFPPSRSGPARRVCRRRRRRRGWIPHPRDSRPRRRHAHARFPRRRGAIARLTFGECVRGGPRGGGDGARGGFTRLGVRRRRGSRRRRTRTGGVITYVHSSSSPTTTPLHTPPSLVSRLVCFFCFFLFFSFLRASHPPMCVNRVKERTASYSHSRPPLLSRANGGMNVYRVLCDQTVTNERTNERTNE